MADTLVRVNYWVIDEWTDRYVSTGHPPGWVAMATLEVADGAICQLRDEFEDRPWRTRWNGWTMVPAFSAPGRLQTRPPDDRVVIRESGHSPPQNLHPRSDGDPDRE